MALWHLCGSVKDERNQFDTRFKWNHEMDAWKFFTIENIAAGIRGQAYKKWFEFVRRFILIDTNNERKTICTRYQILTRQTLDLQHNCCSTTI